MSSDNAIWCSSCSGTDFDRTNGAFYCKSCGTESREHGPDFVYDDDTTSPHLLNPEGAP